MSPSGYIMLFVARRFILRRARLKLQAVIMRPSLLLETNTASLEAHTCKHKYTHPLETTVNSSTEYIFD